MTTTTYEQIIPKKDFNVPYHIVLNSIKEIITLTERKLLLLFNKFSHLNGRIFPKQTTIAAKLGLSQRQVIRTLQSLERKGFIVIQRAELIKRHLYGKCNSYVLTNNPAYDSKFFVDLMSFEKAHDTTVKMSPDSENVSLYNNKRVKETKRDKDIKSVCPYFDIEKFLNENQQDHSDNIIEALESLRQKLPNLDNFNVAGFLNEHKTRHGSAIVDALNAITPDVKYPMAYARKIISIQSGNYNANDHTKVIEEKKQEYHDMYVKIAQGMGFEYTGIREYKEDDKMAVNKEIHDRMNDQRRKLFEMFPVKDS